MALQQRCGYLLWSEVLPRGSPSFAVVNNRRWLLFRPPLWEIHFHVDLHRLRQRCSCKIGDIVLNALIFWAVLRHCISSPSCVQVCPNGLDQKFCLVKRLFRHHSRNFLLGLSNLFCAKFDLLLSVFSRSHLSRFCRYMQCRLSAETNMACSRF